MNSFQKVLFLGVCKVLRLKAVLRDKPRVEELEEKLDDLCDEYRKLQNRGTEDRYAADKRESELEHRLEVTQGDLTRATSDCADLRSQLSCLRSRSL